jgi:hypothetical protein
MKDLKAYCVSKRKKVTIKKVKQVWKAKSRNHYLYLVEGEAPGCDSSVWVAVSEENANLISKHIGKPIKVKVSTKKKKVKKVKVAKRSPSKSKKRSSSTKKKVAKSKPKAKSKAKPKPRSKSKTKSKAKSKAK